MRRLLFASRNVTYSKNRQHLMVTLTLYLINFINMIRTNLRDEDVCDELLSCVDSFCNHESVKP